MLEELNSTQLAGTFEVDRLNVFPPRQNLHFQLDPRLNLDHEDVTGFSHQLKADSYDDLSDAPAELEY